MVCCCSVSESCPSLCPLVNCSTPGSSVLHSLHSLLKCMSIESMMGYLTISFSAAPLSFCLQSFTAPGSFLMSQLFPSGGQSTGASAFVSPSNKYSGLISLRIDWLVGSPCSPRDFQESSLEPQFESINSSALSLLYGPALTSIHDYWKNHSFDYMKLCGQSYVSAF